jgi:hypothetical protein
MLMAKSSIPYEPITIGIDWSDIPLGLPIMATPKVMATISGRVGHVRLTLAVAIGFADAESAA